MIPTGYGIFSMLSYLVRRST